MYLSVFEWVRELLYFLSFIYIINNTVRRSHIRAIGLALLVGLTMASASVIVTYALKIEPGNLFQGVYHKTETPNPEKKQIGESSHEESSLYRRAAGIFVHPADATFYLEAILPLVLGYLVAGRRIRDRLLYGGVFGLACVATYLTFSRAGLVGLFVAMVILFALAGWSGLMSRRALARWLFVLGTLVVLASPLLIYSVWTRPETITKRLELNQRALVTIAERPIFGGGLNNSSAVMEGTHEVSTTSRGSEVRTEIVHNYYLAVLMDVGVGGFVLLFAFFGWTTIIGMQHLREAEPELKILLAGIVAGLGSIAVHVLGDPLGAHQALAMWWLYFGLVIAICRIIRAERARGVPMGSWASPPLPRQQHKNGLARSG
jgi:hypothetical protein